MGTYYPSAQIRLQLRLDDFTEQEQLSRKLLLPTANNFGASAPATESGQASALSANQAARSSLGKTKSATSPTQYAAQKAQLDAARSAVQAAELSGQPVDVPKPEGLTGGDDDENTVVFSCLPQACSIERNNILDPDTAEVTLDFRDVPIDPRSIRSALVTVTIGTVDADSYQRGIIARELRDSDGMLVSVVERQADEELRFTGSQSRFVGFVDEWSIELGLDDTVTLKARDISALLKDERLPAGVAIDLTKPIITGIEELLARNDDFGKPLFPSARGLKIYFGTPEQFAAGKTEEKGPTPGETIAKAHKTRKGKQAKAARNGDQQDSLWDHVVTTCQKLGLIPYMRNFVLFVTTPANVYSQVANGRKMVFGRNLSDLKFSRKLGGVQADTIEMRSFDPDIGRTRWARHPVLHDEPSSGILNDPNSPQPTVSRPSKLSPTGKTSETVRVFSMPRVTDLELLQSIARQTFEEIARQEIEGSFTTDDLDSFRDPDDPGTLPSADLLELQAGEPITILFAPSSTTAQGDPFQQTPKAGEGSPANAQDLAGFTFSRRVDYLTGLGMSAKVAQRLAASQEQIPLANTFKAAYVNLDYSVDDGISVQVSFYNYVVVREEEGGGDAPPAANSSSVTQATRAL